MLRNYYINRGFIVSRTAQRVYRLAAIASIAMFAMLFMLKMARRVPAGYFPIVKLILFAGVAGAALTVVGMEYFLFAFDKSSAFKKAFWFCVMTGIPLLGPAMYCFFVYSRSSVVDVRRAERANDASASAGS